MKKFVSFLAVLICVTLMFALAGCATQDAPAPAMDAIPGETQPGPQPTPPEEPTPAGEITLATTTSTADSGLLDFILPVFTEETGWEIRVISVGTGAALQLGRDGEADVVLVHARAEEDRFVAEGYAERRYDVMYNDFVIVGPSDGPIAHNDNVAETFTAILSGNLPFVSRGDNSGTHIRELDTWASLGLTPEDNTGYIEVGQGMGATLGMAVEMNAFTLVDRATWLAYPNVDNLVIVCEGSDALLNPYGVLVVSTTLLPEGAQVFVDWLTSPATQQLIESFGIEEFGQSLFFPQA